MTEQQLNASLTVQKHYFASGATLPFTARKQALLRLKAGLARHQESLLAALQTDLGKSRTEGYLCEIGLVSSELDWMLRHLKGLMRDRSVYTPLAQFPAKSLRSPSPLGCTLIMSPWNYPVLLTLEPLIDALAAGNTAVLKPSAYAPATAEALRRLVEDVFPPQLVFLVTGGREENQALLRQKFDFIFFTGGKTVGRQVLHAAAEHLTPVVLELGGKSPCIVDETAKIDLAARRIVFGKFLNCGQTCVAPDYILCHRSVQKPLMKALKREITRQFGANPLQNPAYGKIINRKHFDRLMGLLSSGYPICGGTADPDTLQIAPTVLDEVSWDSPIMDEEIFGPLLPVLPYDELTEAIAQINDRPHPLALYLFSTDKRAQKAVLFQCRFGGGCLNDVVVHLSTSQLPFGGVGESGMGCYHGKAGFETFSHTRSILDKKNWLDLPIRYQPYTKTKEALLHLFLK